MTPIAVKDLEFNMRETCYQWLKNWFANRTSNDQSVSYMVGQWRDKMNPHVQGMVLPPVATVYESMLGTTDRLGASELRRVFDDLRVSTGLDVMAKKQAAYKWLAAWLDQNKGTEEVRTIVDSWGKLFNLRIPGDRPLYRIVESITRQIARAAMLQDDLEVIYDALCEETGLV